MREHAATRVDASCTRARALVVNGVNGVNRVNGVIGVNGTDGGNGVSAAIADLAIVVLMIVAWAMTVACASSPERHRVIRGSYRTAAGETVQYEAHHDPNSIRASQVAGKYVVTLTSASNLVSYALPGLKPVAMHVAREGVAVLGKDASGEILAGLYDGRIYRVDPATLTLDPSRLIAALHATPAWLGTIVVKGQPHLVAARTEYPRDDAKKRPYTVLVDLSAQTSLDLAEVATTFFVDSKSRLWAGADHGEWGGSVTRVDIEAGNVSPVKPVERYHDRDASWSGVYGFIELNDGQVWAYGGTSHLVLNSNFIVRVDADPPRLLAAFELPVVRDPKLDLDRPHLPISHIVQDASDAVLVFSYFGIYRTDATLSSWKRVHDLALRYHTGRPDAVGSYPAVTSVHVVRSGRTRFVMGTIGDGLMSLDAEFTETSHAVQGSLGLERVDRLVSTAGGLLALPADGRLTPWILDRSGWSEATIAPPFRLDPHDDYGAATGGQWYETSLGIAGDGWIYTLSSTSSSPGTRVTARFREGHREILESEMSSDRDDVLVTPDGLLWSAGFEGISHFRDGTWQRVADLPHVVPRPGIDDEWKNKLRWGRMPVAMGRSGRTWILLDRDGQQLLGFSYGEEAQGVQLFRLLIGAGEETQVHDALPWSEGRYLLATEVGLRVFDPARANEPLVKPELPVPTTPATRLARDGLGRIWMAGDELTMVRADGSLLVISGVPPIGEWALSAILADPEHADGVVVASEDRGVAFVRVEPRR